MVLSYYPHALLDEWYSGWRRVTIKVKKMSQGAHTGNVKEEAEELLLCNFEPLPLLTLAL